jgi:hypothetical protein
MSLPEVLANLRKRPSMYIRPATYDTAVAFVDGYDAATRRGFLVGFHEWLVVKLGEGNNLAWPALVSGLMQRGTAVKELKGQYDHNVAIEFLFATLEQFLDERDISGGMRTIYIAYDRWLRRQDWYGPSSPDWIPDDSG